MTLSYETFADAAFVEIFRLTPEVISVMGLSNLPEFSGLGGKLNDYSLEGAEQRQQLLTKTYEEHQAYEYSALTDSEQLSYDVFEFFLQYLPFEPWVGLAGDEFALNAYPVRHHDGAPAETFNLLVNFHDVSFEEDADNYLTRLSTLPKMFSDLEQGLKHRHDLGLSPPKSALSIVIDEITALLDLGFEQSDLLTSFVRKLSETEVIATDKASHFSVEAGRLVDQFYKNTLPSFLNCLKDLFEKSDEAIGIKGGDEYYQYCLVRQTTMHLGADEIYALGNSEVARLNAELAHDIKSLGYDSADLKGCITDVLAGNSKDNRDEILAYYKNTVNQAADSMRPFFNLYPKADCSVIATARHLEAGRTTTYYPPSATGEYPAMLEINLGRELGKPHWAQHSLAYHETYPGHHLQIAVAQELAHLPLFRRSFVNAGYLEGWAKYAERLPFEVGVDTDARYELQRKTMELISASNLMLDVAIHTRGWTREKAVLFSMEQAMIDRPMAEYLVDRISVTPAQTTAYMLGLITVRNLRDQARKRRGKIFKLADFHDAILCEGALPLGLLKQHINR